MIMFNALYKKSSTGKLLVWNISVEGATIIEQWGQLGGKIQETRDIIKEGKNLGKANATTPETQAQLEAQAKWKKKLSGHNYNECREAAEAGESSEIVEGGVLPMLAKKYSEDGDKIVWPCAAQKKYDGHRCIATIDNKGEPTLWSRTRKPINSMKHIQDALRSLNLRDVVFDGELYNVDYHDKFEQLTHFIRQSKPEPGCEIVHYHIYDVASSGTLPFVQRSSWIAEILQGAPACLVVAETVILDSEDDMLLLFEKYLKEGFEGLMLRNLSGKYANKRSADLQKVKQFDDDEFRIVGVNEGRGKLQGHGIFSCETAKGVGFDAKMKGDTAELKKFYEHPENYIGKILTVKYQGFTAKGKPRFAVALRVADSL